LVFLNGFGRAKVEYAADLAKFDRAFPDNR
jgi:hypothetical protein